MQVSPKVWNPLNQIASIEKKKRAKKKNLVFYQAICIVFTHLIDLQSPTERQSIHQKTIKSKRLKRSQRREAWREFRIETDQS